MLTNKGFKLAKSKVHLFPKSFKFLSHYFETDKNCTTIPPNKCEAFQNLRNPLSCAELISCLGAINYFTSYIPMLKIITAPLQEMCTSGIFKWEKVHQEAWNSMKLLCSLKFTNSVIFK